MISDTEKYRSKFQKKFKELENKFDIIENDIIELKWEIDDIKEILSNIRCTAIHKSIPKKKSNFSNNESDIEKVIYT